MIRIVADSSMDFLPEECKERNIEMVSYSVTIDGRTYHDGVDITREEYYRQMIAWDGFPTTSQPSPGEYLEHFEAAKEAGDDVICFTLAAVLSGSYQSALLAAQMAEYDRIFVIDSKTATAGTQHMIVRACAMRDAGCTAEEIVEEMEHMYGRIRLYFMVDTLEYLYRGGRLSRIEAVSGRMMRIKPLLMLGTEGEILTSDKCVGTTRAMTTLCEHMQEFPPDPAYPIYSIYSADPTNCERLEQMMGEQGFPVEKRCEFGLTIGTHTGPGAAGVVYLLKE